MIDREVAHRILDAHLNKLEQKEKEYGDSWKKRGGVSIYMNLERKWDRIVEQCRVTNWDIVHAIRSDPSPEGILDDIFDLFCYLILFQNLLHEMGYTGDLQF